MPDFKEFTLPAGEGKKVCVGGGAGFIGSHIAKRLKENGIWSKMVYVPKAGHVPGKQVLISSARRDKAVVTLYPLVLPMMLSGEIDRFRAAYLASPKGQKFLGQTPLIFKEIDEISVVWRNGVNRDLNKQVAEKLKEKGLQ